MKRLGAYFLCWLALHMAGCQSAYSVTAASLTAAEKVVQAASDQFPGLDRERRAQIVQKAGSVSGGHAALSEWDVTADKVVTAINGAHASVKLGADGLKGVKDGLRDPKQLSLWIAPAIKVGLDLVNLLGALGLKLQGVN